MARGSGTSLSGGSLPVEGGIVIGLNRLNRILRARPRRARRGRRARRDQRARQRAPPPPHGLFYAPDPSSQSICTIGGNIAFNSGGAHCLKHGMTANHVLGVEAVLPDGEVVRLGSGGLEPAGPDWLGGFVGSEGLFGIALEATLRLLPCPEATHTVLAAYHSLRDGRRRGRARGRRRAAAGRDGDHGRAGDPGRGVLGASPGYPDVPALLIVELDGERACVDEDVARLREVIRASGATEVRATEDAAERALIWKGRKSAFSAVGWLAPDYIVQDGCVPRTRLGEALEEIGRLAARAGLRVANVFHAGDGNLHPLILFDGREPGAVERAEALAGEILDLCVRLGGSITGEHGVGVEKRDYLPRMFGAGRPRADAAHPPRRRPAASWPTAARCSRRGARPASAAPVRGARRCRAARCRTRSASTRACSRAAAAPSRRSRRRPRASCRSSSRACAASSSTTRDELTITALAGTPVRVVQAALAAHGQHLPFDPPLARAGATLGGVVAAGTSGPGRHRHGGVRDFIIGARFVDGTGALVGGGGRVVKNAAGFDLPQLMVGSMGRLGVLVEVAFKVFPAPPAWGTLAAEAPGLDAALDAAQRARPPGSTSRRSTSSRRAGCWSGSAGASTALEPRLERLRRALALPAEKLLGDRRRRAVGRRRAAGVGAAGGRRSVRRRAQPAPRRGARPAR